METEQEIRKCSLCGGDTYREKDGHKKWRRDLKTGNFTCTRCFDRIYRNPKKNPTYNRRRLRFLGKQVLLKTDPRKGICSSCGRSIEKGEIQRTNLHHLSYNPENVEAHTVELCVRCHSKVHAELRVAALQTVTGKK